MKMQTGRGGGEPGKCCQDKMFKVAVLLWDGYDKKRKNR